MEKSPDEAKKYKKSVCDPLKSNEELKSDYIDLWDWCSCDENS